MDNKIKEILEKIKVSRTTVLILVFVLMSALLVHQLIQLQFVEGQEYVDEFQARTTRTRVLKSTRGNIYDGNGELIASNVLSYSVTLEDNGSYESTREKNLTLNGVIYQVLQILEKNGDSPERDFHIVLDENGEYAFDVEEGFTLDRFRADIYGHPYIDDLKEDEKNASPATIMEHLSGSDGFSVTLYGQRAYTAEELEEHRLPRDLTPQQVLDISMIRYHLNNNSFMKYMPITIATDVSPSSVAAIMENRAVLQGIDVVEDSVRQYVDEVSMGPILGYIGKASAEELENLREQNPNYANDAIVGKAGIEQYMELVLQGTDGRETVSVDNLGKVLKIDQDTRTTPIAGDDVHLTIRTDWQSAIYQILKQRVAGILLSKINSGKTFDYSTVRDSGQIEVPIYDVYNALVQNSVIDINLFSRADASETEKGLYASFLQKQEEVFSLIGDRLTGANPPAFRDEEDQVQEYLTYICDTLLKNTLGIIVENRLDPSDATYKAWYNSHSISLKEFLTYAASQNWLDISPISTDAEYLDSGEIYRSLTEYVIDYLRTDTGFSKLLYKYMLLEERISGRDLCLCLYEQGVLPSDDPAYEALSSGTLGPYDFMTSKIYNLEIEPAQLALMPCSASAVVVDVKNGTFLACVSYPGYDVNRLTNNMDTAYYTKLALDLSSPFYNKATQQVTAPGSTLKLLSTIAGMLSHVIDDSTYIECTGSFDYAIPPIRCWNWSGHGPIEIREAIEQSCNYFFNMIGFQLGKNTQNEFSETQSLNIFNQYASLLHMDEKSGIEIFETAPHVSDSLAIPSYMGQGTNLYTTTQLARYVTIMATRGTVYDLTLLDSVTSPEGEVITDYQPEILDTLDEVPKNVWDDIQDGMRRVVETHEQFNDLAISVSGKTGTAQIDTTHPDHGLFIGYGPSDDPQYAVAVRIANGYSSGNACLAANDIFQYIFELLPEEEILNGVAASNVSDTSND